MDSVYRERAHLVAHLAAIYPAALGMDPAEPDWAVVYIDTAEGQLSWHISPDDMDLFAHVSPVHNVEWDGHSTEEKYARLDALTTGAVLSEQTQDCRSEEGITVGLVDAVISVLRVLAPRDMSPGPAQAALADLLEDPDLQTVRLARRIDGTQESKES